MLSSRGLCVELITPTEESHRLQCVVFYNLETTTMRRPWPALGFSTTRNLSTVNFRLLMNLKIIKYSLSWIDVRACVCACRHACLYICMYVVTVLYTDYTNTVLGIQGFVPLEMWFLFDNSLKHFPSRRRNFLPLLIHNISPAHFVGGLRKLSVTCMKDQTVCREHYPRARKGREKLQCVYLSAECVPSRLS